MRGYKVLKYLAQGVQTLLYTAAKPSQTLQPCGFSDPRDIHPHLHPHPSTAPPDALGKDKGAVSATFHCRDLEERSRSAEVPAENNTESGTIRDYMCPLPPPGGLAGAVVHTGQRRKACI